MKTYILLIPEQISVKDQLKKIPIHYKEMKIHNIKVSQKKEDFNNIYYKIESERFGESILGLSELRYLPDDLGHLNILNIFSLEHLFRQKIDNEWFINRSRLEIEKIIRTYHEELDSREFEIIIPKSSNYKVVSFSFTSYLYDIQIIHNSLIYNNRHNNEIKQDNSKEKTNTQTSLNFFDTIDNETGNNKPLNSYRNH